MLQKVIDYEFNVVQQKIISDYPVSRSGNIGFRYSPWKLNESIQKIPQYYDYNLLWIGNDKSAHIVAFFYCVLLGSLQVSEKKDEAFLKVKYYLYQLCEQYLTIEEQKIFVENICLLQYSKSLTQFLRKTQVFEDVLTKMFNKYKKDQRKGLMEFEEDPMEELKGLAKIFQFINYESMEQKIGKICIKNCFFYLIEESECFFVLEEKNMSPVKKILSESSEELIYQNYRKRSSKKRKQVNSPGSPKEKGSESPNKFTSPNQNYSTPKFHINSNNQLQNKPRNSNEIKIAVFKEESSESDGQRKSQAFDDDPQNIVKRISLKKTDEIGLQNRIKVGSLGGSNIRSPKNLIKEENLKHEHVKSRFESKENYQNPENIVRKRDKIIVQSLGANDIHFRKSIPLIGDIPKEKRSVPKFILEKQKNSKRISPQNKLPPQGTSKMVKNMAKPRISSKMFVNSSILAPHTPNPYLFTYYPK